MVKSIYSLFFLLLSISPTVFATVTATVDKNPVVVGTSFVLEVVADEDVNNNAFDNQALLTDFIVGRTSVSSQTSMINFKTSYTTRWQTVLIAKKTGTFTIPSFNVNGQKTAPIQVRVLAASNATIDSQQNLFIETNVSSKEVYVQQQFTLQVKLYVADQLQRGSLTEPTLEGATITQVGKDKEDVVIKNGRRFRVIERNYAINPEKSGEFMLTSPMFSGEVIKASSMRSSFLSFNSSQPVSVIGKEIPIKIRPIPSSYQGQWLPSELLALNEEWQPKNKKFKVGEPITRTITLTAAGLAEEQLPKLNIKVPKGLKIYPDQAKLHTSINNNKLISQKVKNFAIVASVAGTFTLPKITIPWWNTVTNRYQEAVLPEQTITIVANDEFPTLAITPSQAGATKTKTAQTIIVNQAPLLQWLFLALWLLTSLAWFSSYLLKKRSKAQVKVNDEIAYDYLTLLKLCKQHHGEQVLVAIVPWLNSLKLSEQQITSLEDATKIVNRADFSSAMNKLQQCYYSKHSTDNKRWCGDELLTCIEAINRRKHKIDQEEKLSLNP